MGGLRTKRQPETPDSERARRRADSIRAAAAASISSDVVGWPSESLTAPRARAWSWPIASKMPDGSVRPAWQAEPVDAATGGRAGQQLLAVVAWEADVQRVGQALLGWPLSEAGHAAGRRWWRRSAAPGRAPNPGARRSLRRRRSPPERHDVRHVLGAGPDGRARGRRRGPASRAACRPHVERTDAFGRVHLVPDDRQQVDAQIVDARRHLPDRLGRVGVERHAVAPRDLGDLGDRLERADLVVGVHDRDQHGPRLDRSRDVARVDEARRRRRARS